MCISAFMVSAPESTSIIPEDRLLASDRMAQMCVGGSKRLAGVLDALRAEAPILLVEHDMDAVFSLADRISVLVYGRIIVTGTPDEIRRNSDVRTAYLGEDDRP